MGIVYTPPSSEQLEVTLLGPGYGESIVIHLGANKWAIVDSCVETGSNEPAALSYLRSIGVNPAEAVELIIATHWHDDHIKGLSDIVRECVNATFACPIAFKKEEFVAAISRYNKNNRIVGTSGVRELWEVFHLLASGHGKRKILARSNMRIFSIPSVESGHGRMVQFWSLSPSDVEVEKFLTAIGRHIPEVKQTKYRATSISPNHASLVNLVEIGDIGILLGGDLEDEGGVNVGWSAIISNRDPLWNRASIYKVAHHGSKNAHNAAIWTDLLIDSPFAILTPWNKKDGLPSQDDVNRISNLTNKGYVTTVPKQSLTTVKRDPAVERTIKETIGGKLRRAEPSFGIVRLRSVSDNHHEWTVELSDTAKDISSLSTSVA